MKDYMASFILGLSSCAGGCLLFCIPVLVACQLTARGPLKSRFAVAAVFSLWKAVPYLVFGFLAGALGQKVIDRVQADSFQHQLRLLIGLFLIALSLILVLTGPGNNRLCRIREKYFKRNMNPTLAFLGIAMGILPCVPLLGLLAYITFMVRNPYKGLLYALSFSAGNAVPIILLGTLAGAGFSFWKTERAALIMRLAGAAIVFVWGVKIFT